MTSLQSSIIKIPFKWSISCWKTLAMNPLETKLCSSPCSSKYFTIISRLLDFLASYLGELRQPSKSSSTFYEYFSISGFITVAKVLKGFFSGPVATINIYFRIPHYGAAKAIPFLWNTPFPNLRVFFSFSI